MECNACAVPRLRLKPFGALKSNEVGRPSADSSHHLPHALKEPPFPISGLVPCFRRRHVEHFTLQSAILHDLPSLLWSKLRRRSPSSEMH
jgi:hypothetical protein